MGISLIITLISARMIMRTFLYRHLVKVLHSVPKLPVARVGQAKAFCLPQHCEELSSQAGIYIERNNG
jgi:hypothetical protein